MKTICKLSIAAAILSCPTWADGILTGDTYITTANPSGNFGTVASMNVGAGATALVQFSLGTLPPALQPSQIQSATLVVFVNHALVAGNVAFFNVTSPWSESTVSQNSAPTMSGPFASGVNVSAVGYVAVDVTSSVQTALASGNVSFAIAADSGSSVSALLDSKESTTTSHPAMLQIALTNTGPAGPTGPAGVAGPSGATGPAGPAGAAGPSGATGPAGPAGAAGPSGATGPAGPAGAAGPSGATGPAGPAGANGATGPAGPAGPSGPIGSTGPAGPAGATGAAGPSGPSGPRGLTGLTGPSGPSGPAGPAGAVGPAGPSGPSGPAGAAGTGLSVFDANNNKLGAFAGYFNNGVFLVQNGYYLTLNFSGTFVVSQMWWTGSTCSGTASLNDGNSGNGGFVMGAKVVQYSRIQNELLVPTGSGSVTSVAGTFSAIENFGTQGGAPNFISAGADGSGQCSSQAAATESGWTLTPLNASTALGWTVSGAPLKVAGPIAVR